MDRTLFIPVEFYGPVILASTTNHGTSDQIVADVPLVRHRQRMKRFADSIRSARPRPTAYDPKTLRGWSHPAAGSDSARATSRPSESTITTSPGGMLRSGKSAEESLRPELTAATWAGSRTTRGRSASASSDGCKWRRIDSAEISSSSTARSIVKAPIRVRTRVSTRPPQPSASPTSRAIERI